MTAPRRDAREVDWDAILAYARRFGEFENLQTLRTDRDTVHVPLESLANRKARGRPIGAFGPLSTATRLDGGWEVRALTLGDAQACVEVWRGERSVVFVLWGAEGGAGERRAPFHAGPLPLTYEGRADLSELEAPARALAALVAAAGAPEPAAAFRRWADEARAAPAPNVRTHRLGDAGEVEIRGDGKVYLRITDTCQERCLFCFFYDTNDVDNLVRHHDLDGVLARLDPAALNQVILTGGEPTLHPELPRYVAALHARGFREIILQTNGVRLADDGYLESLLPYRDRLGLGFSLHAVTAEVNDALTTKAGLFEKKLVAIEKAARLGFKTKILLVLSRLNLAELVPFVELCHRLTGGRAYLQFSLPSFQGRMRLFLDTYPRLSELAAAVPPALRRARELGMLLSLSHQCQIPPCILPGELQHLESMWVAEPPAMWTHGDRVYGERCGPCSLRARCSGVWKGYEEAFGLDELVPFE